MTYWRLNYTVTSSVYQGSAVPPGYMGGYTRGKGQGTNLGTLQKTHTHEAGIAVLGGYVFCISPHAT